MKSSSREELGKLLVQLFLVRFFRANSGFWDFCLGAGEFHLGFTALQQNKAAMALKLKIDIIADLILKKGKGKNNLGCSSIFSLPIQNILSFTV